MVVKKMLRLKGVIIFIAVGFLSGPAEARRSDRFDTLSRRRERESGTERVRRGRAGVQPQEVILWRKADEVFMSGDYQQALEFYEKLLKDYPKSSYSQQAVYRQGLCYLKTDLFEKARDCFLHLLKLGKVSRVSPDGVQLSLADSYFLDEDIDRALVEYRKVMTGYPDSSYLATVYFQLGECSRKKGLWSQARHYFQKVSQDYPLSFEAKQLDQILLNEVLFFEVQVGSFKEKENADKLCEQLLTKGYQAYVSRTVTKNKTFYRVRVGRYDSRTEAEFYEKKLRREGLSTKIYP